MTYWLFVKANQTMAAVYAHASVGVLHVRPFLDLRTAEDVIRFKSIAEEVFLLVKKYGGSWSSEHGDGLNRSVYIPDFYGETIYGAFKKIKTVFDPRGLMNPGKIIDGPPIDQKLKIWTHI